MMNQRAIFLLNVINEKQLPYKGKNKKLCSIKIKIYL
jgi:hypothetical protein